MTADQYIALSASVAACMSAVAAFWIIWLTARQQRKAYQPKLALSQTIFTSTKFSEELLPRVWTESRHSGNYGHGPDSAIRGLVLEINNIGLGAANEISVKWSFPMKKAVQKVNEISGRNRVLAYHRGSGRLHVIMEENKTIGSMPRQSTQRKPIDYILPVAIENVPTQLRIPDAYAVVVSAMVFIHEREKSPKAMSVPVLRLNMKYRDIGQRTHRVSFDVRCEVGAWNQHGEILRGYLRHNRLE